MIIIILAVILLLLYPALLSGNNITPKLCNSEAFKEALAVRRENENRIQELFREGGYDIRIGVCHPAFIKFHFRRGNGPEHSVMMGYEREPQQVFNEVSEWISEKSTSPAK